jgi:hypothetical protein
MMIRCFSFLILPVVLALGARTAAAQEDASSAIKRLAFLAGSWTCTIQGPGVPRGDVDQLSYEFAPDWSWMVERSNVSENHGGDWSAQLWGYDAARKQLVAYQFTSSGVHTKTVAGWVGDQFVSTRDDNGARVSVKPISPRAFDWVIESADRSTVVTEACTR